MTEPVTNERLTTLWLAAVEGLSTSRDDILDLIDEIKFLRTTLDMTIPSIPPEPPLTSVALEGDLMPDPWADELPGN